MGLIEKLEQIKTLVESGAGGSGELDFGLLTSWQYLFNNGRFMPIFKEMKKQSGTITSMERAFNNCCANGNEIYRDESLIYDFDDLDLSQCSSFVYCFNGNSHYYTLHGSILNFDMSKNTQSGAYTFYMCQHIKRLTFKGSFGGEVTSSSLTLDIDELALDHDAMIELFNSIKENASGKTRIFKIKSAIYDSLTEDEISIMTNKGYTITK